MISMAYNETYASRLRNYMSSFGEEMTEKKMFGGLSFLRRGKMACGVLEDRYVFRILEPLCSDLIARDALVSPMDFTGKPMKEFVFVDPKRVETDEDLSIFVMFGVAHANAKAEK